MGAQCLERAEGTPEQQLISELGTHKRGGVNLISCLSRT